MKLSPSETVGHDEFRLVNLGQLSEYIQAITLHAATCTSAIELGDSGTPPVQLLGAKNDLGLACIFEAQCQGCQARFQIQSSKKVSTPKGKHFEVNLRAVWGEVAAGGGAAKLNERMTAIGMPGMTGKLLYTELTVFCTMNRGERQQ